MWTTIFSLIKWATVSNPTTTLAIAGGAILPSVASIILYQLPIVFVRTSYNAAKFVVERYYYKPPEMPQQFYTDAPLFAVEDDVYDAVVISKYL